MYTPSHFAEERMDVLYGFIRTHPLAAMVSLHEGTLEATHVPLVLDSTVEPACLRGHLARANAHWKSLNNALVLVIFSGPEHYITPNWYPSKQEQGKVVPTWNYSAVHVWGQARVIDTVDYVLRNVTELTAHNEAPLPEHWQVADAPSDYIRALARGIVGFEILIERMQGTWKLSQNRSRADREGAIKGLDSLGTPASAEMAALMRESSSNE
jgi:transcriptional regulator